MNTNEPQELPAYWQTVLDEVSALSDGAVAIESLPVRSNETSIAHGLRFEGVGGYPLFAYFTVPRGEGPFPALFQTPGYGSVVGVPAYERRSRYAVMALCHRGQRSVRLRLFRRVPRPADGRSAGRRHLRLPRCRGRLPAGLRHLHRAAGGRLGQAGRGRHGPGGDHNGAAAANAADARHRDDPARGGRTRAADPGVPAAGAQQLRQDSPRRRRRGWPTRCRCSIRWPSRRE